MPKRRDEETGRFSQSVSDEEILEVITDTRMSTSEIADEIGYHRTTTYDRLVALEEEGVIESSRAGNTYIWEVDD
ncbi:winged helix-turn-helix domain-containing protein [Halorubrum sp. C191]|uniref:winged helix-turn-helix domain-containing protein n=1 Tax=Halorubrum sp. C191 TaxID=1383842 RepID=UPI0013043CA4|nr:winged helix-turn-helix domain-containing protein [Halorubrum sp. C191]